VPLLRRARNAARWVAEAARIRRDRDALRTDLVELNLGVTWLCNSKCKGCGIWEIPFDAPQLVRDELTLDEIKALLDSRELAGLRRLVFTGGEPLLRKELPEIARHAAARRPGIAVSIVTNGLVRRTPEIARAIVEAGAVLHLSFSLDGIGERHDAMRGVRDNFKKMIALVEALKPLRDGGRFDLGFVYTIYPENVNDVAAARALARDHGMGVGFGLARNDLARFWRGDGSKYPAVRHEREAIRRELARLIDEEPQLGQVRDLLLDRHLIEEVQMKGTRFTCYAGFRSVSVDPTGDVYACEGYYEPLKFGNLRQAPFDALWTGERAAEIRRHIDQGRCQPCPGPCITHQSLQWDRFYAVTTEALFHRFKKRLVGAPNGS
jgi:MoaA/NifB/PqqE/SkfB family radical SAM enzyme